MNFINLQVESINQEGNRIVIKSGGKSYSFFVTKSDGTQSRAKQDFDKLGVRSGQTYSFGVTEKPGEYQGQPVVYRNIGVIGEQRAENQYQPQQNTPTNTPQSPVSSTMPNNTQNYQNDTETLNKLISEVRRIADGYEKIFNEIKVIKVGLGDTLNQDAMGIHEGDNQLKNLQDKNLEPKSALEEIPVVDSSESDVKIEEVPFS